MGSLNPAVLLLTLKHRMKLLDFQGANKISDEETLLRRLTSVRSREYGAFILSHANDHPTMFIHFNRDIAYLRVPTRSTQLQC